jgi:hypothetical protein
VHPRRPAGGWGLAEDPGVRSVKCYSGAGDLRGDLRIVMEMKHAGVYERLPIEFQVRPLMPKIYVPREMRIARQLCVRGVTPELLCALSGSA